MAAKRQQRMVLVSERELVRRDVALAKLARAAEANVEVVVAEKTPTSESFFYEFQFIAATEHGLSVVPIHSIKEAAKTAKDMLDADHEPPVVVHDRDAAVLKAAEKMPSVGATKAVAFFENGGSLQDIANMTEDELAEFKGIGPSSRRAIVDFFNEPFVTDAAKPSYM